MDSCFQPLRNCGHLCPAGGGLLMTNVGARSLQMRKFIQLEKVYRLCTVVRDVL
jgi:hypothetical protein